MGEKISVRSSSDMVKWINVKCTNQQDWKEGAGAYNEGSLQSDHYPGAMGFCGLSLAYHNNKFRYMCLTNGQDATRCYGDDSYQNDLETVMSCTDDYPGDRRPRLTGMKIWTNSGGNDGFRGAEFYFDQTWECSNVLYVSHDTASQAELVGYYERQGYFRGSTYWKHEDDTLDYCMYYQNWSWRIGSCNLDGSAVIRIDQSDDGIIGYGAYKICPEYFEVDQIWLWYEISSSTKITSMSIVGMDAIPVSWGNSVGYWTAATDGTQSEMNFQKQRLARLRRHSRLLSRLVTNLVCPGSSQEWVCLNSIVLQARWSLLHPRLYRLPPLQQLATLFQIPPLKRSLAPFPQDNFMTNGGYISGHFIVLRKITPIQAPM